MQKHKHYNEIIAWAEGKEIEGRYSGYTWKDTPYPNWYPNWEYRVKDPYRELKEEKTSCTNQQAPEPMFAKAKVGDKVFSLQHGEGEIKKIEPLRNAISPSGYFNILKVKFSDQSVYYNEEGKINSSDVTPDLYWDKPQIIAPEKPKKKIQKTINVWVNHFPNESPIVYTRESCAKDYLGEGGKTIPATLTYEIEED